MAEKPSAAGFAKPNYVTCKRLVFRKFQTPPQENKVFGCLVGTRRPAFHWGEADFESELTMGALKRSKPIFYA